MRSLLDEFIADVPDIPRYLRGDSRFASPKLYEVCEEKDCKYAIHLKEHATLRKLAEMEPYQVIQFYCERGKISNIQTM